MPQRDPQQAPPDGNGDPPRPGTLSWVRKFDQGVDLVKGLSVFTVLSSIAVGYFQYLNAYQDKVSTQAKEDMASATASFTEISGAFSEIMALQQNPLRRLHERHEDGPIRQQRQSPCRQKCERHFRDLREGPHSAPAKDRHTCAKGGGLRRLGKQHLPRPRREAESGRRSADAIIAAGIRLRLLRQIKPSSVRKRGCSR